MGLKLCTTDAWRSGPISSRFMKISCLLLLMGRPVLDAQDNHREASVVAIAGLKVAGVSLRGNSLLGEAFLWEAIAVSPGRGFSEQLVAEDLKRLAEVYADQGLPHARVAVADFRLDDAGLHYAYLIEEGPLVTVEKVRFAGQRQTKEQTLKRLAGIREGLRFSRQPVERARIRLVKSGLFGEVSQPGLFPGSGPGRETLVFQVEESSYNSLFGAVGYNRDDSRPDGWLTGRIDLAFSNLAGTGQQAKISWQRLSRENSRLSAEYSAPWIFRWNAGFRGAVRHQIEDSSFTLSSGRTLLEFPAGQDFTVGLGGEAVRVVPGSSRSVRRSLRYSSLWSFRLDGRGMHSALEVEYGRKRYYDPAEQLTVSRIKFDASRWQGLGARHSVYLAGHGRAVISSEEPVPRTEQFALGGANSLRGYWEEQFFGNQLAWSNLEYRYQPDPRLVLFPLLDLGYYLDPHRRQRGWRTGYGAGLMMNTALGWISLSYGLGQGDRLGQGKIHLILQSDF